MPAETKENASRKPGRPPEEPGVYRSTSVRVCLSEAELDRVKSRAGRESVSKWVRGLILAALGSG